MGKTTDALEAVTKSYFSGDSDAVRLGVEKLRSVHFQITNELFGEKSRSLDQQLSGDFNFILNKIKSQPSLNFDYEYDQIVSLGEVISTRIVVTYLNYSGIPTQWMDIRQIIRTDDRWRESTVDWTLSLELMKQAFHFKNQKIYLTQGFIGATTFNSTTTLGREGSDTYHDISIGFFFYC